jgi:hypothetical protein
MTSRADGYKEYKIMSDRFRIGVIAVSFAAGVMLLTPLKAAAQGDVYAGEAAKYPDAASKPTPKMPDGKPDLNGVWHHYQGSAVGKVGDNYVFGATRLPAAAGAARPAPPPKPEKPQYKPELLAKVQNLSEHQVQEDATLHCQAPGVPRLGAPDKIIQTPNQIVFLYSDLTGEYFRIIKMNAKHSTDPEEQELYNGDSIGRWDGDVLVVDATNFTDETWLGDNGLFHSEKLHVVERFQRVGDTIQYQITVDDPQVLVKPWVVNHTLVKQFDELEEAAPCVDKDAGHYVSGEHHDNPR